MSPVTSLPDFRAIQKLAHDPYVSPLKQCWKGTQSIERAVALLRVLAARSQVGCTLSALTEATGIKTTTAHRVLSRLLLEGLVQRIGSDHSYALGPFSPEACLGLPGNVSFLAASQAAVNQFAAATGCAAVLYLRGGADAFVVAQGGSVDGTAERRPGMLTRPGDRRPLLASAGWIAIAARLPLVEQAAVVGANLAALDQRGAARLALIQALLARAMEHGYAWSLEALKSSCPVCMPWLAPSQRAKFPLSRFRSSARLRACRVRDCPSSSNC
jgi:DNA-binding IclR family transcriptional regulator